MLTRDGWAGRLEEGFTNIRMSSIAHYCQRCLAANPLGTDFCGRCGTRLMLVVEPNSSRFEAAEAGVSTTEHLLERISATENRITRLAERLERSLELVLRQAENSSIDRSLLQALVEVLVADGLIDKGRLEQIWNEDRRQKRLVESRSPGNKRKARREAKARSSKKGSGKSTRS